MFVDTKDALLSAVAVGPGPATVMALNGWSAAWQLWLPTFELLSTEMRCISYDTRGTGGSTGDANDITLDSLVGDVVRVLDAYGVARCVLAGESLGGFVAMQAAIAYPERFSGLVLVAAPPFVSEDAVGRRVEAARRDYPATIEGFVRECLSEPGTEGIRHWGNRLFLGASADVAARLFECCYGATVDPGAITTPTVVLHGDGDLVVPVAAGRHLAATIPTARYVELAGAGHAPTVTRPADVAAAIRSLVISA